LQDRSLNGAALDRTSADEADAGTVVIVDYGVGNISSLVNMLDFVGVEAAASSDPQIVSRARRLLLPGVGSFTYAMGVLVDRGLDRSVADAAGSGAFVLGVCLGMQLLGRRSEEGGAEGLGLVAADIVRLDPRDPGLKVPNIGWRETQVLRPSPLFEGVVDGRFYHAHSFEMRCDDPADVVAQIDYGHPVSVAVSRGRIHGVQFHPEKSHRFGMAVLSNFARLAA
jgi:glutamine amidotransferase